MVERFTGCNNSTVEEAAVFYATVGLHPVKIRPNEKRPSEEGWQNLDYSHIAKAREAFRGWEGNIGLRGDDKGIMGVDFDDAQFKAAMLERLPMLNETLQSRGKKETGHYWVRLTTPLKNKSITLTFEDRTKQTFADLRGIGGQIVVAPSIHPEGPKYQWLNDNPILPLDTDVFLDALDGACRQVGAKNPYRSATADLKPISSETDIFKAVKEALPIATYVGSHADRVHCLVHKESTPTGTGAMRIYTKTNSVYCFSCGYSGDVISLNAKVKNITQLDSAYNLIRDFGLSIPFIQAPSSAKTDMALPFRRGTEQAPSSAIKIPAPKSDEAPRATLYSGASSDGAPALPAKITTLFEFKPQKPKEWIVPPLLGAGTIAVIGGARATFKSTIAAHLAVQYAAGKPFLGFEIPNPGISLFWDEENGEAHLHEMLTGLSAGEAEEVKKRVYVICSANPNKLWNTLETFTPETSPRLIILDGLRRFLGSANENDAGEVSEFMMHLKFEAERLNACILFIHHSRKTMNGQRGNNEFEDVMDSLRGSSDINAAVATSIITRRIGESECVHLQFAKTRWTKEPPAVAIRVNFSETAVSIDMEGQQTREDFEFSTAAKKIIEWGKRGNILEVKTSEICNVSGYSDRQNSRLVAWMVSKGYLKMLSRGKYQMYNGSLLDKPKNI